MKKVLLGVLTVMMSCSLVLSAQAKSYHWNCNFTYDGSKSGEYEAMVSQLASGDAVWVDKSEDDEQYVYDQVKFRYYFCGSLGEYETTTWSQDGLSVEYTSESFNMQEEAYKHVLAMNKISELSAQMQGLSDAEKVKWIHDYICNNVNYDYEGLAAEKAGGAPAARSTYLALIEGKAVCSGYAHAFYSMCGYEGIPVRYVEGTTKTKDGDPAGHAWNEVNIDGTWKAVDCTWDDQDSGIDYWMYMTDVTYNNEGGI